VEMFCSVAQSHRPNADGIVKTQRWCPATQVMWRLFI
jgi:hypothetical protein